MKRDDARRYDSSTPRALPRRAHAVVVGSGFAGLCAAIRLLGNGVQDLVVIERGDDVGGTWRDNRYPGCACDVPSVLYSFSFAPNPDWTRRFAPQSEIQAYLRACAERFGLLPRIVFRTAFTSARWEPEAQAWRVSTSRGEILASVLVMAAGPLSEPAVPEIPGLHSFPGPVMHTARWDSQVDLTDKRVGVVGTGASAIQVVPAIAERTRSVVLFQRTPAWVAPRRDRARWALERRAYARFPATQRWARAFVYWSREATLGLFLGNTRLRRFAERQSMTHLHTQVADPRLRAALTPAYELGCKRVLLSDDFYPALTRADVRLQPTGVARVEGNRVVGTDGTAHEVDVLVLATGFHVTDNPLWRHVADRDGRTLEEAWRGHPQAYLGTTVPGFPNLFVLAGPGTGIAHTSLVYMIEAQIDYVVGCVRALRERGAAAIEPTSAAYGRWGADVDTRIRRSVWAKGGCSSWYQDGTGAVSALWPTYTWRFRRAALALRLADHHLTPAKASVPMQADAAGDAPRAVASTVPGPSLGAQR